MLRLKGFIKYKDTKTMKIHPLFCISIILFISCSSTYYVKNEDSSYNEMNKKLKGDKVILKLINGEEISGDNVYVKSDSTSVADINFPTARIKEITINNHGTGALKGMGYGILSTAIISGVSYLLQQDEPYSEVVFIILPPLGLVLGALIGGIHGDIDKFIFLENIESKRTVSVEISSIVEKTVKYIIVRWKSKEIRLLSSEYDYTMRTGEKQLIVVPKEVYLEKFK